MPLWFWLNIPAAVVFIGAISGIPLWMVLKRPDKKPEDSRRSAVPTSRPSAPRPQHEREAHLVH